MKCDSNPSTKTITPITTPIPDPNQRENKKTQKVNPKMDIDIIQLPLSKKFLNTGKKFSGLILPFHSI